MQKKNKNIAPVKQKDETVNFDYKNPSSMSKYVSELGRILSRARTGLTAKEQGKFSVEVKRARMLALMPFAK